MRLLDHLQSALPKYKTTIPSTGKETFFRPFLVKEEKILFGNNELKFKIDPFKKKCLIEGLDDIALSLEKSSHINEFEKKVKSVRPWIFND